MSWWASLSGLEIEEHETLKQVVVEDQVDVEVFGLGADPELSCHERESSAEFEQELLQIVEQGNALDQLRAVCRPQAGLRTPASQDRARTHGASAEEQSRRSLLFQQRGDQSW